MNNKKKIRIKKRIIFSVMIITILMLVNTGATTYIYDTNNRLTEVTYDDGSKVSYKYDAAGNIIETIVTPASIELVEIAADKEVYDMNINETISIKVRGKYSDNSSKEITQDSVFNVADKNIITIQNGGVIFAEAYGETDLNISYLGKTFTVKIKVIDKVAPSIPNGLEAENIKENTVTLRWNSSTDNIGVEGYDIYSGNDKVGNSKTTSFVISGLESNKEYIFKIIAKDQEGNLSEFSEELKIKTLNDITLDNLVSRYNTVKENTGWEEKYDLNKDGIIDIYDIVIFRKTLE